eukprot:2401331-Amphidinium_carterae.1
MDLSSDFGQSPDERIGNLTFSASKWKVIFCPQGLRACTFFDPKCANESPRAARNFRIPAVEADSALFFEAYVRPNQP